LDRQAEELPMRESASRHVNLARHKRNCSVCSHTQREQIETDFLTWKSPSRIADECIYRHAHALGLFEKRRRNVRAALERIIEKADDVEVTASAVVTAVQALTKINAQGQWVERNDHINLNELFERMSKEELESYAREGTLPAWFTRTVSATPADSERSENDE
jgi:hypothetical protein